MIGGAGMLPINLDLTEDLAAKLREIRLNNPIDGEILTAEKLSKAIGNNRAWMSQIESRRLKKSGEKILLRYIDVFIIQMIELRKKRQNLIFVIL